MGETLKLRVNNEIPAYRTGLVAALDVGTSKVACVIGRAEQGTLKVLGSALREATGLKAGTVTSLDLAEESIRDCVAAAENHADARIQNVLISVNCGAPVSVTSRAVMALDGALVSDAHLRQLLSEGRAKCRLEGHEIIQSAPTAYVVDEARGVRDPSGMFCQRIGVAMHAVAVKPSPLANLKLAVERCHLNVVGSLFGAYASGLAVLTEDEKQVGATVIEMGGGCTGVMAPGLYPLLRSGQINGLIGGLRGAAEYESLIGQKGKAVAGMDAQSATHVAIIVLVIMCNLVYFSQRRASRAQGHLG